MSEYILLAEDDQLIRNMVATALCDYQVITVATGKQLFALATSCRDELSLIIADWHMPGWDGDEAVEMAEALGADVPVIWITGHPDGLRQLRPDAVILPKPFSVEALRGSVWGVMAKRWEG